MNAKRKTCPTTKETKFGNKNLKTGAWAVRWSQAVNKAISAWAVSPGTFHHLPPPTSSHKMPPPPINYQQAMGSLAVAYITQARRGCCRYFPSFLGAVNYDLQWK